MTSKTLVVTGATGFVGRHVVRLAHDAGYRVLAIGRDPSPPAGMSARIDDYSSVDLTRTWPVTSDVDAVIHLAGLAAVGPSYADPQRYIETNSRMVTLMGEALLEAKRRPRVLVVSSGAVYAPRADGEPIDEGAATAATSPYAVSKLLVESQADYYARRGLDCVVARPFNHIGPGQEAGFLIPDLVTALEQLPAGAPLKVGNLDTARDYTDVRDVARAYLAIVSTERRADFVYNVASGTSRTGAEALAQICRALGRDMPSVVVDSARLRPGDPATIAGSSARLRAEFAWEPTIDWTRSIADYINATRPETGNLA